MTDSDRDALTADLKLAEGLRLRAYQDTEGVLTIGLLNVTPSSTAQDMVDGFHTHAEVSGDVHRAHAAFSQTTNLFHGLVVQFRSGSPVLSLRSFLKSCRIGVDHLLAHRGGFKIRQVVVFSIPVEVIDGQALRDGAVERFPDQAMHKKSFLGFLAVVIESHALRVCLVIRKPSDWPRAFTPEPGKASDVSRFVDVIQRFVAENRLPHGLNFTIGGGY